MASKKTVKAAKKKPTIKKKSVGKKASAKRRSVAHTDRLQLSDGMKEYLRSSPHVFSFSELQGAVNAYHRQAEINQRRGLSNKGYHVPEGFQDGYGTRTPRGNDIRPLKPYNPADARENQNLPRFLLPFLEFGNSGGRANYQRSPYYNNRAPKR